MNVKELKTILENALSQLDGYDDEEEINLVGNTYFLGYAKYFLGVAGYDGGYVNLSNPIKDREDY